MSDDLPNTGERVEILHNGAWIPATFWPADFVRGGDGEESWWLHYYRLEDGTTAPADIQSSAEELPQWRRINPS